ncbi:trypsin-like serine protease [Vibrio nigripulchritudo]|uniref:trypsin-like serine protease n=1 Tax=Vibrio nigripulchritudo TaxID=28173 RepID=UPI0003B17BD1|nr:trypsin-like serine protease [Vibrio nigripulchritudo]CCN73362.1 putative trypsin-like serine protease [Vibrio nigripulchritudo SFn118]
MRKKLVLTLPLLVGVAQASSSISPTIVNGNIAKSTDYPSIATLFVDTLEYDGRYSSGNFCGASILDANHVLTAAHCVYNSTVTSLFTTVVPQLDNEEDFPTQVQPFGSKQRVRVSEIYYPDDYSNANSDLLSNDIAVLKLETPLTFSSGVFPSIPLTMTDTTESTYRGASGAAFTAVGHGNTQSNNDDRKQRFGYLPLLKTQLEVASLTECKAAFIYGDKFTDKQLCFKDTTSSGPLNSACQGDSGGPIYWTDPNTKTQYQVGVASFATATCGISKSGVTSAYTEVKDYQSWITSVINGNETPKAVSTDALRKEWLSRYSLSNSTESSGGSLGWLALAVLFITGTIRKK